MPFPVPAFRASLLEAMHAAPRSLAMKIPPLAALHYLPAWQSSERTHTAQGSVNAVSLDLLMHKADTCVREAAHGGRIRPCCLQHWDTCGIWEMGLQYGMGK